MHPFRFMLLRYAAVICLLFNAHLLLGQITISSPVNNQVLQRNLKDSAYIAVTGYTHRPYQTLELRLETRNGTSKDVVENISENQLSEGFFHTIMTAPKGWHRLSATGTRADGRKDTVSIGRVGVGEIFLIAGNSNAMGVPGLGALNGSENVVTFDTVNKVLNADIITVAIDEPMRTPFSFAQFSEKRLSYPTGETSWFWGELGDMIYTRFGTPVMFLNAGWAAASSINYREAASGKDTFNNYVGKNWPYRQPYTNIPNTLRYFNSWLGIRAILWSHGENDAYHVRIDQDSYFKNIQYLVQRTREDFGYNVPWVIGRHTVTRNENKPYAPVIQAQTALGLLKGFNTWLGPNTDTIQVPRPDHGHFENVKNGIQGLSLSAAAWNRSLPDTFFRAMIPLQPTRFLHAGTIPASTFPGASFTIPFSITGNSANPTNVQAEILSHDGKFVALAGTGKTTPLSVKVPLSIPDGHYRIRLVLTSPVLVGSNSETIEIDKKNKSTGYINHFKAEQLGSRKELSWVMAANPGIQQLTLQKSFDHITYADIKKWAAADNQLNSRVYSHSDPTSDPGAAFYRIRMEYGNGSTTYSQALVLFGAEGPPRFVVYPNPVTEQSFFLRPEAPDQVFVCKLYDTAGKQHPITIDDTQIIGLTVVRPLYYLPSGIYILSIHTSTSVSKQRVMFR